MVLEEQLWLQLELKNFVHRWAKMLDILMGKRYCLDHVKKEINVFNCMNLISV